MTTNIAVDPRYPVGRFDRPKVVSAADRERMIADLETLPGKMRAAVAGLADAQLDTPYRDGGWTARQVVHHVPDSHMNAYCRFRLALTEDNPTIKTYDEARWAELPDAKVMPVDASLQLIDALHQRWVVLLRGMKEGDWARTFKHAEWGDIRLDSTLALYAWHGRHHTAHITRLREAKGW
jgi:hypothetical protein